MYESDLRKLHLHVGENVEKSHHGVPQPTVGQTLLVAGARTLKNKLCVIVNVLFKDMLWNISVFIPYIMLSAFNSALCKANFIIIRILTMQPLV